MSRPKALWWVGAGELGSRVGRVARAAGLAVIATDRDGRAAGAPDAARVLALDGEDAEAHAAAARELAAEFEVVEAWCGAEFGARAVDAVRRALDLPRHEAGAVDRALDKTSLLAALADAGLDVPRGTTVRTAEELAAALDAAAGAVAVKPTLGSGSRGVVRVAPADAEDPASLFAAVLAPVGGAGAVVVEPWVVGRSIDANGLFVEGRYHRAGTLEKFCGPPPVALPLAGLDPAPLDRATEDAVHAALEAGGRGLGLVHGPVKGDFLVAGERVVTLEVAPRLHGDVTTSNTLPFGTGIDPVAAWFGLCATGELDESLLEPRPGSIATWRVIVLPPGRVLARPGSAPLPEGVTLVWHNARAAERIVRYEDTRHIPGYVAAHGRDLAEAEARLVAWAEHGLPRVEPGPDAAWADEVAAFLDAAGLDPRASGWRPGASGRSS